MRAFIRRRVVPIEVARGHRDSRQSGWRGLHAPAELPVGDVTACRIPCARSRHGRMRSSSHRTLRHQRERLCRSPCAERQDPAESHGVPARAVSGPAAAFRRGLAVRCVVAPAFGPAGLQQRCRTQRPKDFSRAWCSISRAFGGRAGATSSRIENLLSKLPDGHLRHGARGPRVQSARRNSGAVMAITRSAHPRMRDPLRQTPKPRIRASYAGSAGAAPVSHHARRQHCSSRLRRWYPPPRTLSQGSKWRTAQRARRRRRLLLGYADRSEAVPPSLRGDRRRRRRQSAGQAAVIDRRACGSRLYDILVRRPLLAGDECRRYLRIDRIEALPNVTPTRIRRSRGSMALRSGTAISPSYGRTDAAVRSGRRTSVTCSCSSAQTRTRSTAEELPDLRGRQRLARHRSDSAKNIARRCGVAGDATAHAERNHSLGVFAAGGYAASSARSARGFCCW